MTQITINDLTQLFNISTTEAQGIYKKYAISLKNQTKENLEKNLQTIKKLGVTTNSYISSIALSNFNIFLVDNALLEENLTYIVNRFKLIPINTRNFLTCKAHRLLSLNQDRLINRLNEVKTNLNINEYTLRNLLTQTISLTSATHIENLYKKTALLESLDVDYKNLKDLSILNNNINDIKYKTYIAKIVGVNNETFAKNAHISTNSIFARFMAWYNGEISSNNIFLPAFKFTELTGIDIPNLINTYPFDTYQASELEIIFKNKCPELYKKHIDCQKTYYDEFIKNGTKYHTVKNAITDVLLSFGFSDTEIYKLAKHNIQLFKLNPIKLEENLTKLNQDFRFSKENLYNLIINNINALTYDSNKFLEIYTILNNQNNLTYEQFKKYITYNKSADCLTKEFINNYTQALKEFCGFTLADCNALLKTSPSFAFTSPNRLLCKLKVLEMFGISKEDLNHRYAILTPGFRKLTRTLKMNKLCELNSNEDLILTAEKLPTSLLNQRFLYLYDNNLDLKLLYTKDDNDFEHLTGASKKSLHELYGNPEDTKSRIDELFKHTYPKLNKEIDRLHQIYDTIKEEDFSISIMQDDYTETNRNLLENTFRINNLNLSDKELSNINTLLDFGYTMDEILKKPNAIKLEPETMKIRLIISKQAGQSNDTFLSGGYKKREDKMYARLMGLKASFGKLNCLYLNEEQFNTCTGLKTDKLTILFPYTEDVHNSILQTSIKQQGENEQ